MAKNAIYYFCKPNIFRGLDEKKLQEAAKDYQLNGSTYNYVAAAYEQAMSDSKEADFIYVGGSTFVVAEIL